MMEKNPINRHFCIYFLTLAVKKSSVYTQKILPVPSNELEGLVKQKKRSLFSNSVNITFSIRVSWQSQTPISSHKIHLHKFCLTFQCNVICILIYANRAMPVCHLGYLHRSKTCISHNFEFLIKIMCKDKSIWELLFKIVS